MFITFVVVQLYCIYYYYYYSLFIHSCIIIGIYYCIYVDDEVVIYMAQVKCKHSFKILYDGNYGFSQQRSAPTHTHTHLVASLLQGNAMSIAELHILSWIVHFHTAVAAHCCMHTAVSFFM